MKYRGKIKADGTIEFLGSAPPGLLQVPVKRRFSEIVPANPIKRRAFRALRWMFGEDGRVSEWTRRWWCLWECTILIGPCRGMHRTDFNRKELIAWEQGIWRNN